MRIFKALILTNSNLAHANLQGADLRRAQLSQANLEKTQLEGANLLGAQTSGSFKCHYQFFNRRSLWILPARGRRVSLSKLSLISIRLPHLHHDLGDSDSKFLQLAFFLGDSAIDG